MTTKTKFEADLAAIPQFKRGQVWCRTCGSTLKLDAVKATTGAGWPKCCGYTMTIDSPEEQAKTT